jgi:tetratricopeptide (TPR) repeat protein
MTEEKRTTRYERFAAQAAQHEKQGQTAQAARFYRLAGEYALAAHANEAAKACFTQALALTPDANGEQRYELLLAREGVLALTGDQEGARADLASLERVAATLNDDAKRTEVATRWAEHRLGLGDHEAAISMAHLATRLAQQRGNSRLRAGAELVLGQALMGKDSYAEAEGHLSQALASAQAARAQGLEAESLRALGTLHHKQANLVEAEKSLKQAQALFQELGDDRGLGGVLNGLGHIAYDGKWFLRAGQYWEQAQARYEAVGDRLGQLMILVNLGAMRLDLGDYARAQGTLEDALAVSREIKSRFGESMALINLGLVFHYRGAQKQALSAAEEALSIAEAIDSRRLQGYALVPMGHAYLAQSKPAEAEAAYWRSLAIWHELAQPSLETEQKASLARAALAQGEDDEAMVLVEQVLAQLDADPALEGTEAPFRVYHTCYQVLDARDDARSGDILEMAHNRLQAKVAAIPDEEVRETSLREVVAHRELVQAYAALAE